MPEENFKYDVFLSHAGEDTAWCEKLAHRLREEGFRVWFDKWEMAAGDHLVAKINQGLEQSDKMVCVWTSGYFRDDKVWTIVEAFSELHSDPLGKAHRIIPILLDTCKIPPTLRGHIYVDCCGERNIDVAVQGIMKRLGSPSTAYALWDSRQGKRLKARVEKIKNDSAVLRIKTLEPIIQNSEVLQNFEIVQGGRLVHVGRATVKGVVDLEAEIVCEVSLEGFDAPSGMRITGKTKAGIQFESSRLRFCEDSVLFELSLNAIEFTVLEEIPELQVWSRDSQLFSGSAIIENVLHTATEVFAVARLARVNKDLSASGKAQFLQKADVECEELLRSFRRQVALAREFRTTAGELRAFLQYVRTWCEAVEFGFPNNSSQKEAVLDEFVVKSGERILSALSDFSNRLDQITYRDGAQLHSLHRHIIQTEIQPFTLCAPFVFRSYFKPIGYAGDFAMVNFMFANPFQGESLFSRIINAWMVKQPVCEAFRVRANYLYETITREVARVEPVRKQARIMNFGCGPAIEVQRFLQQQELSNSTSFTLVDFNQETLEFVSTRLGQLKSDHGRTTTVEFRQKSVYEVLKGIGSTASESESQKYDLVYCSGLFEYLSDKTCDELMDRLFDLVAPQGLLLVTCLDSNSLRPKTVESMLEWHMIYRSRDQVQSLRPNACNSREFTIQLLPPGVFLLEARK